ncbi:hypothetical protein [Sinomonas sp. ASV322]|uniref:hypothetical protein n=1 Tax=Sinomonas sp. ASV322 TaxID=3041920 RepID=UPI0027DC4618|nr:hypothetical protein [Sinomonas sp. ASV322]MDQ4503379.1 hypothetical protein [Sinomonas sp. ASV322]
MLFATALVRTSVAGRRPAVVVLAPIAIALVLLVLGVLVLRDLQGLHLAHVRVVSTAAADARRVTDLAARLVAACAGEAAVVALLAGLGVAFALVLAPVRPALGALAALAGIAVVVRSLPGAVRSQRDARRASREFGDSPAIVGPRTVGPRVACGARPS